MLKKYQVLLLIICRDEHCKILAVRYFMEGAFQQENKSLFCKRKQGELTDPRVQEEGGSKLRVSFFQFL